MPAMQIIKMFSNVDVTRDMDRQVNADIFPTCVGLFVLLVLCRFTTPHTDMLTTAMEDAATPIATTGEPVHLENSVLCI